MTKEEVRQVLLSGEYVHYHVWTYWKSGYTCTEGCCLTDFPDITLEEIMETIEEHSEGKWEECFI